MNENLWILFWKLYNYFIEYLSLKEKKEKFNVHNDYILKLIILRLLC